MIMGRNVFFSLCRDCQKPMNGWLKATKSKLEISFRISGFATVRTKQNNKTKQNNEKSLINVAKIQH